MRKKLIFNQKGFTLVELLLAAGILTFVFGSLLLQLFACILLNESNRNFTTAVNHAQFVMEDIRNVRQLGSLPAVKTKINAEYWNWDEDDDFTSRGLQRLDNETIEVCCCSTCTCSPSPCTPLCSSCPWDPIRVLVKVEWKDREGRVRSTYLSTLITSAGWELLPT